MKRFSFILMALAMVMGMTQCKKDNTTSNTDPVYDGPTTEITLTLSNGSNNRADVIPDDPEGVARVTFKIGDTIEVAYQGAWVGRLTCQEISSATDQNDDHLGVFRGTIAYDAPETGSHPLDFFFLGNKVPTITTTTGYGVMTVDLSDQSKSLPVISYAPSQQNFQNGITEYTVEYNWLMNQCALMRFDAENIYDMSANTNDNNPGAIYKTTQAITIYGMDNQVSIALNSKEFAWGKADEKGAIKLYRNPSDTEGASRYAIVHHADYSEVTAGELEVEFNPATDLYGFFGTYKIGGNVEMNDYYQDAKLDLVWHSGAFSIESGKYVVFSRGNLQYADLAIGTTRAAHTWRFAKHQFDFVGGVDDQNVEQGNVVKDETGSNATRSNNENIGNSDYDGWIDLFGWGTGMNPTTHSSGNTDYGTFNEWGQNNIVNSGTPNNTGWWSTLSHNEWKYLADRDNKSKVGLATITPTTFGNPNSVRGLVLLPDVPANLSNWKPVSAATALNYAQWNDNTYTVDEWIEMEKKGAVFLPASGWRNGQNWRATLDLGNALEHGAYYSKTTRAQSVDVYSFRFGTDNAVLMGPDRLDEDYYMAPDNGHNVRLVHRLY